MPPLINLLLALAPVLIWYIYGSPTPTVPLQSTVMTTFSEPQNPKLGVYASPAEWRERLQSLPDRESLGGKIPSFYCKSAVA